MSAIERRASAGETIYQEGDPAAECFLLKRGRIRTVKSLRGEERNVSLLTAGDLFGAEPLVGDRVRRGRAIALVDVTFLAVQPEEFDAMIAREAISAALVRRLLGQVRDLEAQIESSMLRDHPSRVIHALLQMSDASQPSARLRISPLELSSRVGLDVDAVKRAIVRLRQMGYLDIEDESILLRDIPALDQLYELLGEKEQLRSTRD